MKKILKITSLFVFFTSIISCDLDVNDPIDNVAIDKINPNELIIGAQTLSAKTFTNRLNRVRFILWQSRVLFGKS